MLVPYGQARMWYWFHDRADNPFYPDIRIRMTGPRSFSQSPTKLLGERPGEDLPGRVAISPKYLENQGFPKQDWVVT